MSFPPSAPYSGANPDHEMSDCASEHNWTNVDLDHEWESSSDFDPSHPILSANTEDASTSDAERLLCEQLENIILEDLPAGAQEEDAFDIEGVRSAAKRLISKLVFNNQRGTTGQWAITDGMPDDLLAKFDENMPVHHPNPKLLELIPREARPIPPETLANAPPNYIEETYFWLLDLRDRLWAQSTVLKSDLYRDHLFPGEAGPIMVNFLQTTLNLASDGLFYLENSFPNLWSTFRTMERDRILRYKEDHVLKLIQPYLVPMQVHVPDYNPLVYAAFVRKFGPISDYSLTNPFKSNLAATLDALAEDIIASLRG